MTIYTHGTRSYAEATARIIDPDGQYFGKRIVSRTDHPDLGLEKCLSRLFLEDWSMAVVLDDRDDVWRKDQQTHVVCIKPYLYFHQFLANGQKGQLEINNAPGLSTVTSLLPQPPPTPQSQIQSSNNASSTTTTTTSISNDITNETSSENTPPTTTTTTPPPLQQPLQQPLQPLQSPKPIRTIIDDDTSLLKSLDSLLLVHQKYYELLEKGEEPNVGFILSSMRKSILKGCHLCFSGLINVTNPNINPKNHKLWIIAETLGATVSLNLTLKTTHLLTLSIETEKSRECVKLGNIYICHPDWLLYCYWHIIKEDESTYLLAPIVNKPNIDDVDSLDNTDEIKTETETKVENEELNETKKRSRDENSSSEHKINRPLLRSNANVFGVNYNSSTESSDSSSDESEKPRKKIQRMFTNDIRLQKKSEEDDGVSNCIGDDNENSSSDDNDDGEWLHGLENDEEDDDENQDNSEDQYDDEN